VSCQPGRCGASPPGRRRRPGPGSPRERGAWLCGAESCPKDPLTGAAAARPPPSRGFPPVSAPQPPLLDTGRGSSLGAWDRRATLLVIPRKQRGSLRVPAGASLFFGNRSYLLLVKQLMFSCYVTYSEFRFWQLTRLQKRHQKG